MHSSRSGLPGGSGARSREPRSKRYEWVGRRCLPPALTRSRNSTSGLCLCIQRCGRRLNGFGRMGMRRRELEMLHYFINAILEDLELIFGPRFARARQTNCEGEVMNRPRVASIATDAFYDNFTCAALFRKLRIPGSPEQIIDPRPAPTFWVDEAQQTLAGVMAKVRAIAVLATVGVIISAFRKGDIAKTTT